SERLPERPQIDFLRPGRTLLAMDLPIGIGDRIEAKHTALPARFGEIRLTAQQPIALDSAVDHDMGDVNSDRPELPRHALRNQPQARLGSGELRETRLAAQASGRPGEDHGSASERHEPARGLAADQESGEAANAPKILEPVGGEVAKIDLAIVAGVEHDEV